MPSAYAQHQIASAGGCIGPPSAYKGFIVKQIQLDTRLLLIPLAIRSATVLHDAQQALRRDSIIGLEVGQAFTPTGQSNLNGAINAQLNPKLLSGIYYIQPSLSGCDTVKKEISVRYSCIGLSAAKPQYSGLAFELPGLFFSKKDSTISVTDAPGFSAVPYIGYNESRSLFGGARLGWRMGKSALIKEGYANANFSASSSVIDLGVVGSHTAQSGLFDYAEWRLGYHYATIQANTLRLTEGTLLAQVFGATRPLPIGGNLLFRYGLSIEGGNRLTNLDPASLPTSDVARSGYGAAKIYIGSTANWFRHSLKLSYGLQLGNTGQDFQIQYLKHIADAAYRGRFLVADHRPLQVDAQITTGQLQTVMGDVPAGERFFGGNAERNFIEGDGWQIRSNPYIRSIPQNGFNGLETGTPVGGSSFQSGNLTLSWPVWHKPMLPKEVVDNGEVGNGLGVQLRGFRALLAGEEANEIQKKDSVSTDSLLNYDTTAISNLIQLMDAPPNIDILTLVDTISQKIQSYRGSMSTIPNPAIDPVDEKTILDKIETYIRVTKSSWPTDSDDLDNATQYRIESILIGYGPAVPAYLTGIGEGIRSLKQMAKSRNKEHEWAELQALAQRIAVLQNQLQQRVRQIPVPLAEQRVKPTMTYVGRTLGVLFREMNIAAISPLLLFDVARLQVADRPIVRYGLGAGIRLSLALADFHIGYSINLNRQAGERGGALVFGFSINPF